MSSSSKPHWGFDGFVLASSGRISGGKIAIRRIPNTGDASSGADKQRCRCQTNKRQQQRILDQILALLIV
jgi:hypothetical protein